MISRRCQHEAYRMLRQHQDAEEVAQEAMARAWRHRRACRTPEAPLGWCLQITRNEALRLIGRGAPRGELLEMAADLSDSCAAQEADRAVIRVDVEKALDSLSASERELIALRYGEDRSHPEIASELGIPEATARVRLHRTHRRLRGLLAD